MKENFHLNLSQNNNMFSYIPLQKKHIQQVKRKQIKAVEKQIFKKMIIKPWKKLSLSTYTM